MYKSNDVCVVGRGGLYSGTWDFDEFTASVFEGKTFISDLRDQSRSAYPFDLQDVFNSDPKAEDQTYSAFGAVIDRAELRNRARSSGDNTPESTVLDAVTLRAFREAIAPVSHLKELRSAEIILGLSTIDSESSAYLTDDVATELLENLKRHGLSVEDYESIKKQIEAGLEDSIERKPRLAYVVASTLLHRIKKRLAINGPSSLIDAACASSLAALYIGIKRLRQGEADLVITGGADVSVSPGCLVYFSRLGATSAERTLPFDSRARGLSQGEGAGIFALMRIGDAVEKGLKIFAVLKSCEGSSDGSSSGIVEPTAQGQLLAYQRAYADAGLNEVDYIEAHGTGTVIGDRTEIESLSMQFPNKKIPIGSVKSNYGHTIGAAGAAGLLKCLSVIERRAVPPSPYFTKFPQGFQTQLFLNKKTLPLPALKRPITIGQSSFGFGGSNFHLVVQEFLATEPIVREEQVKKSPVVVCGSQFFAFEENDRLSKVSQYRLPPNIVPWIEKTQLLAIYGLEETFRILKISPTAIDRSRVSVLASSMIPLEGYWDAGRRVVASAFQRRLAPLVDSSEIGVALRKSLTEILRGRLRITEDTLSGFLNNVVAGRVCNAFDFKGVSFNVDADLASESATIRNAQTILSQSHGMVVVISADESIDPTQCDVRRTGLRFTVMASAAYALEHDLPIFQILKSVTFRESCESHDGVQKYEQRSAKFV